MSTGASSGGGAKGERKRERECMSGTEGQSERETGRETILSRLDAQWGA